jgi:hypothetical protein
MVRTTKNRAAELVIETAPFRRARGQGSGLMVSETTEAPDCTKSGILMVFFLLEIWCFDIAQAFYLKVQ